MFIFSSPKPGRLSLEILEDLGTKIIQLWNVYPLWNLNELDIFWIILAPNKTFFCSQTVLTWKQMWCFENHHKSEPYSERQISRLMSYQKINFNPSQNLVCWDRINMVKLIYLTWINTTTISDPNKAPAKCRPDSAEMSSLACSWQFLETYFHWYSLTSPCHVSHPQSRCPTSIYLLLLLHTSSCI